MALNSYITEETINQSQRFIVLKAKRISDDHIVMIKTQDPTVQANPALAESLKNEAIGAEILSHPNIRKGLGYIEEGDGLYFLAEYAEGVNLADYLHKQGGKAVYLECLRIGRDILHALLYASDRGIRHGNLNPYNIIIAEDGSVKLIGFNKKRAAYKHSEGNIKYHFPILYTAPETFTAASHHPNSDIYSWAVIIYQSLCGHLPWKLDSFLSPEELKQQSFSRGVAMPSSLLVPDWLYVALLNCLKLDPNDRPEDIRALLAILKAECEEIDWEYHDPDDEIIQEEAEAEPEEPMGVLIEEEEPKEAVEEPIEKEDEPKDRGIFAELEQSLEAEIPIAGEVEDEELALEDELEPVEDEPTEELDIKPVEPDKIEDEALFDRGLIEPKEEEPQPFTEPEDKEELKELIKEKPSFEALLESLNQDLQAELSQKTKVQEEPPVEQSEPIVKKEEKPEPIEEKPVAEEAEPLKEPFKEEPELQKEPVKPAESVQQPFEHYEEAGEDLSKKRKLFIILLALSLIIIIYIGVNRFIATKHRVVKEEIGPEEVYKPIEELFANELIAMVKVPSDTLIMGSIVPEAGDDEFPLLIVPIKSFMISPKEITQKQWNMVNKENPSQFKGEDLPVEGVTFYEVIDYCNEKSKMDGLTPVYSEHGGEIYCNFEANGYRLPTEAEWELAAKGGDGQSLLLYSGSDSANDVGWHLGNSEAKSHSVALKKPNQLSLYDMSGNVAEWVWNWYVPYSKGYIDLFAGPYSGTDRVVRGGSWYSDKDLMRVSARSYAKPYISKPYIGFRVVRSY